MQLFNALAQMIGFDKGIFHGYICAIPIVVIWRNDAVEKLLSSSRLITKQFPYTFLLPWLGTGLLTRFAIIIIIIHTGIIMIIIIYASIIKWLDLDSVYSASVLFFSN